MGQGNEPHAFVRKDKKKKPILLLKYKQLLELLCQLSTKKRSQIIASLKSDHVNCFSEICYNLLKSNLTTDTNVLKKLKKYKVEIRNLALKKNPIYKKKKKILTSPRGSGLLSILLPVVTSLVSGLLTK